MDQLRTGDVFDKSRIVEPVVVVGAGAIGTAVALHLAKLNVPMIVMDDDKVEGHNLSNQCVYGPSDIGLPKVDALAGAIGLLSDTQMIPVNSRLDGGNINDQHIFLCVDNMTTRREVGRWCSQKPGATLVDGRMGAYDCSAFLMRRDVDSDRKHYADTLFDDKDAHIDTTSCGTVMSIGATAQIVASNMIWMWMDHVMGRKTPNAVHQSVRPWFAQHVTWG